MFWYISISLSLFLTILWTYACMPLHTHTHTHTHTSSSSSSSSSSSIPWPRGSLGHHRWFCNQFSTFFPVLHCPLGLAELQARPFLDVVFSPLPLSALCSSPSHCALQDCFGQTWWMGKMTIPLQFASLYNRQEIFMWSNCLLDLGMDLLIGNMVFVWDV